MARVWCAQQVKSSYEPLEPAQVKIAGHLRTGSLRRIGFLPRKLFKAVARFQSRWGHRQTRRSAAGLSKRFRATNLDGFL
jgi:hypothetical protein